MYLKKVILIEKDFHKTSKRSMIWFAGLHLTYVKILIVMPTWMYESHGEWGKVMDLSVCMLLEK